MMALLTEDSEILRIVRGRADAAPSLRAVRVVRGRGHGRGGDHLEALSLSLSPGTKAAWLRPV